MILRRACSGSSLRYLRPVAAAAAELEGTHGRYRDKTVIVTGGAKGIGEGCVRVFHAAGSNVVIGDMDSSAGEALAAELNGAGSAGVVRFQPCDVRDPSQLETLVDVAATTYGCLDCVISNAGWHPPPTRIDDFSVAEFTDLLELNLVSSFALCKYALPHLRASHGNVVNIASIAGVIGQAEACTYAATKGALVAFTKSLAIDEAPHGVRVNSISPGHTWTPLWKEWSDGEADPGAAVASGDVNQWIKRKGTAVEVGRLSLCIAADLTYVTGVDHLHTGGAELGFGVK